MSIDMVGHGFQRARRPEQKRQRRADILQATAELLEERTADAVSLSAIARRVGLAKSNVYRYFEGREQILMTILQADLEDWSREVAERLNAAAGRNSAAVVAAVVAETVSSRPRLCQLESIRGSVLEGPLSESSWRGAWQARAAAVVTVGGALHRSMPAISERRCVWAVPTVVELMAGLWPQAGAAVASRREPVDPGGVGLELGWPEDLELAVRALLYGLQVEGWRESGKVVGSRE